MSNAIVQINFSFDSSRSDLEAGSLAVADTFAGLNGLAWKIWLIDEETKTAGGIYLFDTLEKARAYADSDIVSGIRAAYANFDIKVFDVLTELSEVTRAPLVA